MAPRKSYVTDYPDPFLEFAHCRGEEIRQLGEQYQRRVEYRRQELLDTDVSVPDVEPLLQDERYEAFAEYKAELLERFRKFRTSRR